MKKDNSKYNFALILLVYILAYSFKLDKTLFSFPEFLYSSNQYYNEQPFSKNSLYSIRTFSSLPKFFKSSVSVKQSLSCITVWRSISHSYDLSVKQILKCQKIFIIPTLKILANLFKQNIFHQSSEEKVPKNRFYS
jgi:hypothetical protein